jgi:hypothetical protein
MNVNNYERRLVATLDRAAAKRVDSMFKPFATAFASPKISETRREAEPVTNPTLLAGFLCVHGVPYLYRDTNLGCKRCGSYTARKSFVATI